MWQVVSAITLLQSDCVLQAAANAAEDVGSNFDGSPDLQFRMATKALALEQSGLSYQSVAGGLSGLPQVAQCESKRYPLLVSRGPYEAACSAGAPDSAPSCVMSST